VPSCADDVAKQQQKVLVYCMSGVTRCAAGQELWRMYSISTAAWQAGTRQGRQHSTVLSVSYGTAAMQPARQLLAKLASS
jgi:hypothetical protein